MKTHNLVSLSHHRHRLRGWYLAILLLCSTQANAQFASCDVPTIDINAGDVVSAEMLNDIFTQLNNVVTSGMTNDNILGTYSCTATLRGGMSGTENGFSLDNDTKLYRSTQDVVFAASGERILMSFDNAMHIAGQDQAAQSCTLSLLGNRYAVVQESGDTCGAVGMYSIARKTKVCFEMTSQNSAHIVCDKKNTVPNQPLDLGSTTASSSISLAWTASTSATSYDIHRKTTATGSFASIGTATTVSYSDTGVTSGATYWYRVFAKNANGTSTGSNVIKLTFNPSAALSSSSIGITDYINGIASSESEHKLFYSTESNTMTANLDVGQLDAENLNGLLAGSGGISPVLKFTLANVPSAGMSGTAKLTSKVLDGGNATLTIGERAISTTTDVGWSSDGEKLLLTVPNQTVEVILTGSSGTSIVGNWSVGGSSDLMTITSSGINKPVTLDVKLLEFLSSNIGATGPSITNFFTEGTYFYDIKIAGIGLMDSQGNTFNNVQGAFGVDSNPGTVAYIDDVAVSEEFDMATILVTLSTPSSQAVTLNYDTSGDSATSGQDYTASSGSLRIAAGNKVGAFTIPLTNDSYNESNEIFSVSLSNISNATLARTTAKVTIIDNDVSS